MRKTIYFTFFLLLSFSVQAQKKFYVSPTNLGDDINNDGLSETSPFKTIDKALGKFNNTDSGTIYLLEGIYHEEIEINNKKNIQIIAKTGDNVVINGTIDISSTWTQHNGNVYKTPVSEDVWQLFIDDKEKVMARWPNTTFENDAIYDHTNWAHSSVSSSSNGTIYDNTDASIGDISTLDPNIDGALIIANVGSFRTYVRDVTSDIYSNNKFDYDVVPNNEYKTKHHYYFLEKKLSFLDTSDEWFFGLEGSQRYLYAWSTNSGDDLNNATIKGKTQTYAFQIINSDNITIQDCKFFATTVRIKNGDNIKIKDNVFSYPNCSRRMLGEISSPLVTSVDQDIVSGKLSSYGSENCTFEGNVFEYTDGEAMILAGNNHKILNNYFHHIDYSCGSIQGIGLSIFSKGMNMTFEENIMHTTGASATLNLGHKASIRFNDISNTGYAQSDGSIVQITKEAVVESETSYNWLHDSEKYGFRFDAPTSAPCTAGEHGLAHHNVIWNMGDAIADTGGIGMMVKGDNQEIYNNTVFNCLKTDLLIISEQCKLSIGESNLNTFTRNNLADFISYNRTKQATSLTDIPGTLSNNITSFKGDADEQTKGKLENIIAYDKTKIIENRALYDFRPKASTTGIIDQGIVIDATHYVNVKDRDVTNGWKGTAPDIGAYEIGGEKWVPGIDFTPTTYPWAWPSNNNNGGNPPVNVITTSGFINHSDFESIVAGDKWSVSGGSIIGERTTSKFKSGVASYTLNAPNKNWDGSSSKTKQTNARLFSDKSFEYNPSFVSNKIEIIVSFWILSDANQDNGAKDRIKLRLRDGVVDNKNSLVDSQIIVGDASDGFEMIKDNWLKIEKTFTGIDYQTAFNTHIELWLGNLSGNIYVDDFTTEIKEVHTLSNSEYETEDIVLYPQPVHVNTPLKIGGSAKINTVSLFNIQGKKVLEMNGNIHELPTDNLIPGVYLIQIRTTENRIVTKQIVIL